MREEEARGAVVAVRTLVGLAGPLAGRLTHEAAESAQLNKK